MARLQMTSNSPSKSKIPESTSPNVANEDNDDCIFMTNYQSPGPFTAQNLPTSLHLVQRQVLNINEETIPMKFCIVLGVNFKIKNYRKLF